MLSARAQVSGTVFRDFNANGIKDATEGGVASVTVTAYFNATLTTTVSATTGAYSFLTATIPSGTKVRVEFNTGLNISDFSGPFSAVAAGNGTSVQFVTAGSATNINFAVNIPVDYCQANPLLITPCYINGATTPVSGTEITDVLVKWSYTNSGTTVGDLTHIASRNEIGSVWGIAYSPTTKFVYSSTVLKRHVGIKDNDNNGFSDLGAIYKTNISTGTSSLFMIIPNAGTIGNDAARGLGASTVGSADPTSLSLTMKAGLGDIDISEDEKTLYVVNLNDKKLYEIDIATASVRTTYTLPTPCDITKGTTRPFGLGRKDGKIYVGIVCDASTSGAVADLSATVYRLDGTNFTQVLTFPLNYTKEEAAASANPGMRGWFGWSDDYNVISRITNGARRVIYPQPVLSDIDFDGLGNMVLGFIDRTGFQGGFQNTAPQSMPTTGTAEFITINGGDILHATPTGTGLFVLEANPGTAEFFSGDDSPVSEHHESALGGVAVHKSLGEIVTSAMDPSGNTHSSGVVFMSAGTGARTDAYEVYHLDGNALFGKGTGLGDMELACAPAPIEIGNRVWSDANNNGIQDPAETGLSGVIVRLFKNNVQIAQATTSTNGEYYFSSNVGTNTTSAIYNLTALTPGSNVELRIDQNQVVLNNTAFSSANQGSSDAIDSDFTLTSGTATAALTLGLAGVNLHTFDAGVFACPTIAFTAPTSATTTVCANTIMTFSVNSNAVAPNQIRFVYFNSPLASATDAYTAIDGTVLGTVTSTTVVGTKTVSLTNVQLSDNQSGNNIQMYVYAILVSNDGLCQPVAQRVIDLKPRPITGIDGDPVVCRGSTAVLTASGDAGTTFQWFLNNGTTAVSTANPFTTPAISTTTTYRVRATLASCISDDAEIQLIPVTCTPCVSGPGTIGGNVFRDFNSNGVNDTDPGLGGITVTIFSCDPSGSSVQVAQMQTDIKGQYSFTGLTGSTDYRIEFNDFPAGYEPTYRGTNNGSSVQFTRPGSCSTSLGLNQPNDYCQVNPLMVTTCFVNGSSGNATTPTDVLVKFGFTNINTTPTPSHLSNKGEIGSVWAVGYNRETKQLFTGTFLKRHVGVRDADGNGTPDLGVIWVTSNPNATSSTNSVWADLSKAPYNLDLGTIATDAVRGLGAPLDPSADPMTFPLVGKVGLGDLDVSEDGKALWVVNPKGNAVHKIAINPDGTPGAMQSFTLPTPCSNTYDALYIKAGGSLTGKLVDDFTGDEYYAGGTVLASTGRTGTAYSSARTGTAFSYLISLKTGTYDVQLSFGNNTTVRSQTVAVGSTTQTVSLSANATAQITFSNVSVADLLTIRVGSLNATAALLSGIKITSTNGTPFVDRSWPFALAYKNGKVYVGTTCAAELSQDKEQLASTVYELDDNGTATFAPVLTVPLNYLHGQAFNGAGPNRWQAWTGAMDKGAQYAGAGFSHFYQQPVLSDIDFLDNGDMVLGFFDRWGHQTGDYNYTTTGTGPIRTAIAGDILRANYDSGTYQLESNGRVSGLSSSGGVNNMQGPSGGEFYAADVYSNAHLETSYGGIAVVPGTNLVAVTSLDPLNVVSSGVNYYSNADGTSVRRYQVTPASYNTTFFSKANALGDLQALCDQAPVQIGNRVWRDDNQNGIQDPCEPAIPGAVVKLYNAAKTTVIASATTNAAGEYYFSSATVVAGTSTSSVSTSLLTYNTTYGLVITSLGTSSVVAGLSLTNVSPVTPGESGTINSGTSLANNDAKIDVVGGISSPCIKLTTGSAGETNHTYDFGITIPPCAKPTLTTIPSQTLCQGTSFSMPLVSNVISNTFSSAQWYLTNAAGTSFTAISGATSLSLSAAQAVVPTVGQSKYYALIAQNGLSTLCSDTIIVNLALKATPVLTITVPSAATVTQCASGTMAFSVSTNAVTPDAIKLVYFTSPQSGTAMYTGGTSLGTLNSTTATGTKTVSFTALLPSNPTSATTTIYVYAFLSSNDGACKASDVVVVNIRPDFATVIAGVPYICKGGSATLVALATEGSTLLWSTGQTGVDLVSINPLVSATATSPVFYSVTVVDANGCASIPASYTVTPVVCNSCASSASTIGGNVFQDYNADGTKEATDRNLAGTTVTLFVCDPNGTSTQVTTTTTDLNGAYSFTGLTPGTTYRVEFSNFPVGYTPTYRGANNGSTVQFVQPGTCNASLGLNLAYDYCQTDPSFAVVCFTRNNDGSTEPTIIDMKYSTGLAFSPASTVDSGPGWGTPINSSAANYPVAAHTTAATKGDIGTTFGLAWDRQHQQLLSGASMRGYAPMQTNSSTNGFGEATIYKVNYSTGSAGTKSVWLDLETLFGDGFAGAFVPDATYPGPEVFGITNSSPAKIGYTGLGSIQFARDNHELYAVNLKTQEVLVIPVAADGSAVATAAQIKRFPFPTDGCPTGNWSDGRPYRAALGLGVHPISNRVYATLTCTGPTLADMKGIVYSFDPSDSSPSASDFRQEVSIPLDLDFPATNVNFGNPFYGQVVHAWDVVAANTTPAGYVNNSGNTTQNTQPWLGEVEFDRQANGTYGLMVGTRNRFHDIINSSFYVTGGALFRAFNDGSDATPSWTLEQHGTAGTFVSAVNYSFTSGRAGFYTNPENRFFKYVGREGTMLSGTSDYIPGRTEIIIPAEDNVWNSSTSGITWLNRITGDRSRDNHLLGDFNNAGFDATNFTKANNWGGLVVMCAQEPIQIGNRVWRDDNKNGIQDPCEPPIVGAVVKLYDAAKTTVIASVTTNAAGEYYFSSTTITTGNSTSSVATTALTYNTTFGLVITSLGTGTAASGLTLKDVTIVPGESGSINSGLTLINNDAKVDVIGGLSLPCIKLTTGGPGDINHTYDFGMAVVPCSISLVATPGTCQSATSQYTLTGSVNLTATPAGSLTITDGTVSTVVAITVGQTSVAYSLSGLPTGSGVHTVSVFSSATACSTASTTYTAPASCTLSPCGLALVVTPGLCLSATNSYILSGSVTATNVPTSGTLTLSSGSFTPRIILLPLGNASGSFSYSGLVSNGQTYTVTASYSDLACAPVSKTYSAPASCSVAPVCSLSAVATAGLCSTATNTYSVSVAVSMINAPAGTITVTLPGLTPITQTIAANTSSFTAVFAGLTSDGVSHLSTISLPGCGSTTAGYVAPVSCSVAPVCSLSATVTPGLCQSATNTFTNVIVVQLANPIAGVLTVTDGVGSQTFVTTAGTSATFTATFAAIPSDGSTRTVTATLPGCSSMTTTYSAPVSCSVAPTCSLSAVASAGICSTATNTYSATVVVSLTNAPAGTLTIGLPGSTPFSQTLAANAGVVSVIFTDLLSDGVSHLATITMSGCGSTTASFTAPVSCSIAPVCSISAVVTAGFCATATNTYSATALVTVVNPGSGGTVTISTGGQTITFSTTALSQNTFRAIFNGLVSDGTSHTLTANLPGCGLLTTNYTAPMSCSVAPVCSLSAVATIGQCSTATNTYSSTVSVTLTNPTAGTLIVVDGVHTVNFAIPATTGTVTAIATLTGIVSDGASHTIIVSLPGCSTTAIVYTAPASCTASPLLASLGDLVWKDNNDNGIKDLTEPGVAGVKVELFAVVGGIRSNSALSATVTDASGYYGFPNLPLGDYQVRFSQIPTSCTLTPHQNVGVNDAVDSDVDPATGFSQVVHLDPSGIGLLTSNPTIDAGLQRLIYDPTGYIYCYKDNTILKGGKISVAGPGSVTIVLDGSSGYYRFLTDGTPGSYTLAYSHPNGYSIATSNWPPSATAVDPTTLDGSAMDKDIPANGWIQLGSLPNADTTSLQNGTQSYNPYYLVFIVQPGDPYISSNNLPVNCDLPASLGDYVWLDTNKNGVQDGTETGVQNVTVTLCDATSGTVISTTLTDGSGKYLFANLNPGTYIVKFTAPTGTTFTVPNSTSATQATDSNIISTTGNTGSTVPVSLTAGENNLTIDAGLIPVLGSIGNFVWKDLNKNGQQDSGEPGADGVTIRLLVQTTPGTFTLVSTTVTAGGGGYLFTNLPVGTYVVEIDKLTLPATCTISPNVNVGNPTSDSDTDPGTGRTGLILVDPTDPNKRNILTIGTGLESSCQSVCIPISVRRTR